MTKLSIVIPTFNEQKNQYFFNILNLLKKFKEVEIIISDGGSRDETRNICEDYEVIFLENKTSSRAKRIKLGIEAAKSDHVLIHHPRSLIDENGLRYLLENCQKLIWGGFTHAFDKKHPLLAFTSWYSNNVRAKIKGILYLDHCIFINKELFETIRDIPDVDIFEDTIISYKLLEKVGKPQILPFKATTSAVRFKTNGVFKQSFLNQILKIKFLLGFDHKKMNEKYEKNTSLNSKY